MPSLSRAQQRMMHGIASGSIPAGKGKPSKKVAQEFAAADHKRGATKLPQNVGRGIIAGQSAKDM